MTEESLDYYFWRAQERKPSQGVQHYSDWVTEHFEVTPQRSTLTSKASGLVL